MRILVGYLRTPEGRAALEAAITHAKQFDATLVVAHASRGTKRQRERDVEARRYHEELEDIERRLAKEHPDSQVRELIRSSSASADLVELSHQEDIGLLVIGIRRRSPVGKVVLGSNAQHILLHAWCPVLAVKAGPAQDPSPGL